MWETSVAAEAELEDAERKAELEDVEETAGHMVATVLGSQVAAEGLPEGLQGLGAQG